MFSGTAFYKQVFYFWHVIRMSINLQCIYVFGYRFIFVFDCFHLCFQDFSLFLIVFIYFSMVSLHVLIGVCTFWKGFSVFFIYVTLIRVETGFIKCSSQSRNIEDLGLAGLGILCIEIWRVEIWNSENHWVKTCRAKEKTKIKITHPKFGCVSCKSQRLSGKRSCATVLEIFHYNRPARSPAGRPALVRVLRMSRIDAFRWRTFVIFLPTVWGSESWLRPWSCPDLDNKRLGSSCFQDLCDHHGSISSSRFSASGRHSLRARIITHAFFRV